MEFSIRRKTPGAPKRLGLCLRSCEAWAEAVALRSEGAARQLLRSSAAPGGAAAPPPARSAIPGPDYPERGSGPRAAPRRSRPGSFSDLPPERPASERGRRDCRRPGRRGRRFRRTPAPAASAA